MNLFIYMLSLIFLISCSSMDPNLDRLQDHELSACIAYSNDVQERFPNISIVLYEVFDAWKINWQVTDTCLNNLRINNLSRKAGKDALAEAFHSKILNNVNITLNVEYINKIKNVSLKNCNDEYILKTILIHEFGHVLEFGHEQKGIMNKYTKKCSIKYPTKNHINKVREKFPYFTD